MGNYSSALVPDTEEFESIVTEALTQQKLRSELQTLVTLVMEERKETQGGELESSRFTENCHDVAQNGPAPPTLGPGLKPHPKAQRRHTAPNLEELQTELTELRSQFQQMKTQHNKEIKLLMNELDEEKKIRLTLQMEIQRLKKHMSKRLES